MSDSYHDPGARFRRGSLATLGIALALVGGALGCDQTLARSYGGSAALRLPPGRKLVSVTWKESSLWHLTRPMRPDEQPETLEFIESSRLGVAQGKVVLIESR